MTENMRHLIVSLRVAIATFGINIGMAFASLVIGNINAVVIALITTFVCACCWFAVEREIKREQNDTY